MMLALPPDYEDFKAEVTFDQSQDDLGVYEVWWMANSRWPDLSLSQRLAVAEMVVNELLADGQVALAQGEWTGPRRDRITVSDPSAAVKDWATWTLPAGQPVVWMTTLL